MRIALLMSHADRSMSGAVRDLTFLRNLGRAGATVAAFRMHKGREIERETFAGGAVPALFLPVDDPEPIPHKQVSAALVEAMRTFDPDVVLMKGLGYDVNSLVRERLDARAARLHRRRRGARPDPRRRGLRVRGVSGAAAATLPGLRRHRAGLRHAEAR